MTTKKKAAIFNNDVVWLDDHAIDSVYASGRKDQIAELTDLYPTMITSENFNDHIDSLQDMEVIFSTWGMTALTDEQVKQLPNLKAVFYAAGATNNFRQPFLENGVIVCSANKANAIPVAEYTLGQILLSCKGYFRNTREATCNHNTQTANGFRGRGVYGARITIIGNGNISTKLQELLSNFNLDVIVVPARAANRTISLEDAFATSTVVVNLLPDRDDNAGTIEKKLISSMPQDATFINVGRGRQVNEPELIATLKQRTDLTALLDVQWPEPPEDGSYLYSMENIQLTSHMAGSIRDEYIRMADFMISDFKKYEAGEELEHEVDINKL